MSKPFMRVLSFLLASLILISSGALIGIQVQLSSEHSQYYTNKNQSKNIAIVMQDMGVEYNGERYNFSQEIIKTLDDNCFLASRAEGEKGLFEGNFAAVITFPADFSKKIAGINLNKPEKATFLYKLNTNLSQQDTINTLLQVLNMEAMIQERISFMFLASIMNELHSAQGKSKDIIANSETSVQLAEAFADGDYSLNLIYTQIEANTPDVEAPDFVEFNNSNSTLIQQWSTLSNNAFSSTNTDYQALLPNGQNVQTPLNAIKTSINSMNLLAAYSEDPDAPVYDSYFEFARAVADKQTMDYLEEMLIHIERTEEKITVSLGNSSFKPVAPREQTLGKSDLIEFEMNLGLSVEGIFSTLGASSQELITITCDDYIDDVMDELLGYSGGILLGISGDIESILRDTLPEYPTKEINKLYTIAKKDLDVYIKARIKLMLQKQMASETDHMDNMLRQVDRYAQNQERTINSSLRSLHSEYRKMDTGFQSNLREAFTNITTFVKEEQRDVITKTNNAQDSALKAFEEFQALLSAFDIMKYYSDNYDELAKIQEDLNANSAEWNEKVFETIAARDEAMYESYGEYQENLFKIMEDMNLSKDDAAQILNSAIEELLLEEISNMDNTKELAEIFSNKLPNSHIGTQGNNDFYDFVISPTTAKEDGVATSANAFSPPEYTTRTDAFWPIVYILVVLLIVVSSFAIYIFIKYAGVIKKK